MATSLKIEKGDQLTSELFIMERTVPWSSTNGEERPSKNPSFMSFLQLKLSSRFVNLCTNCGETLCLDHLCKAQKRSETSVYPPQTA